jgi:hypothetical protein
MQMIAWGAMMHDYSEDRSLTEAAEMTFGGEHPCEMCRKIAEAREQEKQPDQPGPRPVDDSSKLRLDFHFDETVSSTTPHWPTSPDLSPGPREFLIPLSNCEGVPTPPPRFLIA